MSSVCSHLKSGAVEDSGSGRGRSSSSGSGGAAGEDDTGGGEGSVHGEPDGGHREGAAEDRRSEAHGAALCKNMCDLCVCDRISLVYLNSFLLLMSFSFLPSCLVSVDGGEGKTGEVYTCMTHFFTFILSIYILCVFSCS